MEPCACRKHLVLRLHFKCQIAKCIYHSCVGPSLPETLKIQRRAQEWVVRRAAP